jgi:hypothetical protein
VEIPKILYITSIGSCGYGIGVVVNNHLDNIPHSVSCHGYSIRERMLTLSPNIMFGMKFNIIFSQHKGILIFVASSSSKPPIVRLTRDLFLERYFLAGLFGHRDFGGFQDPCPEQRLHERVPVRVLVLDHNKPGGQLLADICS